MDKNQLETKNSKNPKRSDLKLADFESFYFVGIGGIGMSALARYFRHLDKKVMGYDKVKTKLTKKLSVLGMTINYIDQLSSLQLEELSPNKTLIIYTPAIPKDSIQLNYFFQRGFTVLKRAQVLGMITRDSHCFAVAGTHGKTTTSSILGHLLYQCDVSVTAFLGGICVDYDSNFIYKGKEVTVVEADEYDRSFLALSPDYACITSMDADHLDIYGEKDALVNSFIEFSEKIDKDGKLFIRNGLSIQGISYGLEDDSDYAAVDIAIDQGAYTFNLRTPKTIYNNFRFNLPGRHNLSNAIIALAMTVEFGCPPNQLAKALASFKGVERRFNYHIKEDNLVYIDDYAHHPTEIRAVYDAIYEMYPNKPSLVIFQPHLFSRTKDFADEFAEALSNFTEIILLDIYPAREEPIEGINSNWLLGKIENPNKKVLSKIELLEYLKTINPKLVLSLGAGDIGEMTNSIKNAIRE